MQHTLLTSVLQEPDPPPQSLAMAIGPSEFTSLARAIGPRGGPPSSIVPKPRLTSIPPHTIIRPAAATIGRPKRAD